MRPFSCVRRQPVRFLNQQPAPSDEITHCLYSRRLCTLYHRNCRCAVSKQVQYPKAHPHWWSSRTIQRFRPFRSSRLLGSAPPEKIDQSDIYKSPKFRRRPLPVAFFYSSHLNLLPTTDLRDHTGSNSNFSAPHHLSHRVPCPIFLLSNQLKLWINPLP